MFLPVLEREGKKKKRALFRATHSIHYEIGTEELSL
jgi:hypothetical protein